MSTSHQNPTEADRLTNYLHNYLDEYRQIKNMEEVKLINLTDDARDMMVKCGAHLMQTHIGKQSDGYGIITTMSVPPDWLLTESVVEKSLEVFDFNMTTDGEQVIVNPLFVFSKGAGYDPVCVYKWHINDTNIYKTKLAQIHDYLKSIKKNWR